MLCKCSGKYIDIYFNLKITYLIYIYICIRSAFYVFSVRKGGGAVNFGSLFSFIIDIICVFSDDVDIFG